MKRLVVHVRSTHVLDERGDVARVEELGERIDACSPADFELCFGEGGRTFVLSNDLLTRDPRRYSIGHFFDYPPRMFQFRSSGWLLAALTLAGCGYKNVPSGEAASVGSWSYATAATSTFVGVKFPAISKGKLIAPEASFEASLTTPQGVVLTVHSKCSEAEFDNGGKQERARIPTAIDVIVAKNDGWTVTPIFDGDPMPYLDARADLRHEPVLVKLRRTKAGPFGSDMTEVFTIDVYGDGRIQEQGTVKALHEKF